MPANMMNAVVGSSVNVTGRSNATVMAGPMPGRTPTAVPSRTPSRANSRLTGVSASTKPFISSWKLDTDDHLQQHPAGERHVERLDEDDPDDHGRHTASSQRADPTLRTERLRNSGEHQS